MVTGAHRQPYGLVPGLQAGWLAALCFDVGHSMQDLCAQHSSLLLCPAVWRSCCLFSCSVLYWQLVCLFGGAVVSAGTGPCACHALGFQYKGG
jgi:hypothetical protein